MCARVSVTRLRSMSTTARRKKTRDRRSSISRADVRRSCVKGLSRATRSRALSAPGSRAPEETATRLFRFVDEVDDFLVRLDLRESVYADLDDLLRRRFHDALDRFLHLVVAERLRQMVEHAE